MEVGPARHDDASAVCTVLRRSITALCVADHRNDPRILDAWLANKTPEMIGNWVANHPDRLLVAVDDADTILGVGCVDGSGEILLNYVSPNARFRGVSKAIIAALKTVARDDGHTVCLSIRWFLAVFEWSPRPSISAKNLAPVGV
jgi:GNAT superfamily N-acetyltransferase